MRKGNFLIILFILFQATTVSARFIEFHGYTERNQPNKWEKMYYQATKKWDNSKNEARKKISSWFGGVKKSKDSVAVDNKDSAKMGTVNTSIVKAPVSPKTDVEIKAQELKKDIAVSLEKENKESFKEVISSAAQSLATVAVVESVPARKGTSNLPLNKRNVPYYRLKEKKVVKSKKGKKKVVYIPKKKVPLLDIGEEAQISMSELVPSDLKVGFKKYKEPKALKTLPLVSSKKVKKVAGKRIIKVKKIPTFTHGEFGLGKVVSERKIKKVPLEMLAEKPFELKHYHEFSRSELKMLRALILNRKGDKCHAVAGLFFELESKQKYAEEAQYNLALCTHKMGFSSEAVKRLLKVIKSENPKYTPTAIKTILTKLPAEYEVKVAKALLNLKNKELISNDIKDRVNYHVAKGLHHNKSYVSSSEYALKVSSKSQFYPKSQYVLGINYYTQGKVKSAEKHLTAIKKWFKENKKTDKDLESLASMNLARIKFQQNRFKEALADYNSVHKESPYWVQALTEQAWAQLQVGDPEGAIGNMYSLHSPYFQAVYKPESYVVRAIGYLNICQYGDAYRTITGLENIYKPWKSNIDQYLKTKKKAQHKYYGTVKNYLLGKSTQGVDGLPYQVIRELGRQRTFLNAQDSINQKEDEIAQMRFIRGFINKEKGVVRRKLRKAKERLAKVKLNLKKAKTEKGLLKFVNEWKAQRKNELYLISFYRFELATLEQGKRGYRKLQRIASKRLNQEKAAKKWIVGGKLRAHLRKMSREIGSFAENNEFLRYEAFAGSGENIRYQVSGGSTSKANRVPASVKPQKIMNWQFDGEYWEDEIGSYRSSLTNNCPEFKNRNAITPGLKNQPKRAGL